MKAPNAGILVLMGIILLVLALRSCEDNMKENNVNVMPTATPNTTWVGEYMYETVRV